MFVGALRLQLGKDRLQHLKAYASPLSLGRIAASLNVLFVVPTGLKEKYCCIFLILVLKCWFW